MGRRNKYYAAFEREYKDGMNGNQLGKLTGADPATCRTWMEKKGHKKAPGVSDRIIIDDLVSFPSAALGKGEDSDEAKEFEWIAGQLGQMSKHEVQVLLRGLKGTHKVDPKPIAWSNEYIKIGVISDTHIGHKRADQQHWEKMCAYLEREKVDIVVHPGDITEGMSGRDGHSHELEAFGATAQCDMAVKRFNQLQVPIYGITGNHDLWAWKKIGFEPGEYIENQVEHFHYLGQNEAMHQIGNIKALLWHGGDGSSYATSYRTQKFVEMLTGGEKPHILFSGHAHKAIFHQCRNVMVYECGTMCRQTEWMRGKKLAAHVGFWIVEVWQNDLGLERIRQEWIPFF